MLQIIKLQKKNHERDFLSELNCVNLSAKLLYLRVFTNKVVKLKLKSIIMVEIKIRHKYLRKFKHYKQLSGEF